VSFEDPNLPSDKLESCYPSNFMGSVSCFYEQELCNGAPDLNYLPLFRRLTLTEVIGSYQ
jgi:hypothetical protein